MIAVAAMAGSILPGWAIEAGRYRPWRWVRASRWAVAHTDSGGQPSWPGQAAGPARGHGGVHRSFRASGLGEHEQVAVDAGAAAGRRGAGRAGAGRAGGELPAGDARRG